MTKEELAELLNGRQYGVEITDEEEAEVAASGLVVVFGASDDLMEFRGCVSDEIGAWDGRTAYLNASGKIIDEELLDTLREHGLTQFTKIDAIWCPKREGENKPYASWLIDAEMLDTASFDIMEDGELFCRGIVFDFKQLALSHVPA